MTSFLVGVASPGTVSLALMGTDGPCRGLNTNMIPRCSHKHKLTVPKEGKDPTSQKWIEASDLSCLVQACVQLKRLPSVSTVFL